MLGSCLIILMSKGVVDVARVSRLVEQTHGLINSSRVDGWSGVFRGLLKESERIGLLIGLIGIRYETGVWIDVCIV